MIRRCVMRLAGKNVHALPALVIADHGRVVWHGVAVRWTSKAWLCWLRQALFHWRRDGYDRPIGEWVMKQSCLRRKSICDDLGMDLAVS